MRFVDARRRAADDRAAIGRHFVQARPSADVAQPLERAHPRVQPRPDFVHEEALAVVAEMIPRRLLGRRVAGQYVGAVVVEIDARGVHDHAVGREVGRTVIDQANLAANRLTQVGQPGELERARRPCAAGDRDRVRGKFDQMAGGGFARSVLGHHANQGFVGERVVGAPASDAYVVRARLNRVDKEAVEVFGAERLRAGAIVLLEQVGVDQAVFGREGRAGDPLEAIDFGYAAIDRRGVELLDRMAQLALDREMLPGLGPGRGVVQPEVALLAKADLLAHAFVVLDRGAAERDVDRLPPGRAHPAGVLFARTEAPAEVDIDDADLDGAF